MSSQAVGRRFKISRGGCWQCVADCCSRLSRGAEVSQVAYNIRYTQVRKANDNIRKGGTNNPKMRAKYGAEN